MKKTFKVFCFGLLVFLSQHAFGQASIDKGNVLLNVGIGAGYYYAGGVPFVVSAEFAINDAISIGPYLGITSYRYKWFGEKWTYTFIDFGARGSYHFSKHLNLNTDNLDLYGGAMLGYRASSYSGTDYPGWRDPYGSTVTAGIFGGARWYFSDVFSVNGEVGYGISPLLLGVSFKF